MRARWLFLLAATLFVAAFLRDQFDAWIDATELPPLFAQAETSFEVLDRNGELLRAYTVSGGRWRLKVDLEQVDPLYLEMLIAYEDKRFATHNGVDPYAMLRAFGQAVRNGRVVSGGSTLTMQVARIMERSGTGALSGKLRQLRVALALERRLTKDEILTLYLNSAPFGGNLEGVRAASRAYFGKEPTRLTPAEAALLVALPQSPETRRPDRHPDTAEAARSRVLTRMTRFGIISEDRAEAALREPIPRLRRPFPSLAPHFSDTLRVHGRFLRRPVETSIDATLQASLERLAREAVRARGARLSAAIIVIDHRSGETLASVGTAAYANTAREGFVDMTQAIRSPGSTLKPLVYGLAFDDGLVHPETLIDDRPTDFNGYRPQNFDGEFRGSLPVREALQLSLNIPVVALTKELGPDRLFASLDRAIGSKPALPGDRPGLAIALGGIGISLEDLARLYATIARQGRPLPFRFYGLDPPEVMSTANVISPVAAWHVTNILSDIPPPPGRPHIRLPYKTGTSYGHRDAWAVGFDGAHVIAVWMGRPDGTPVPGAFGAESAAPMLFDAFQRLKPRLDPLPPPPAATLMVSNTELPQPLRRFRPRNAVFAQGPDAPKLAFPPDGAQVETGGALVLKVEQGTPPFTWLADGHPIAVGSFEREEFVEGLGPGFVTLSVIDAEGRSAGATVRLD